MTETTDPAIARPEIAVETSIRLETLVYLYGDLFVSRVEAGKKGMRCFSSGAVVTRETLAVCMNAAVLVSMHCKGFIKLETFTKKLLGAMPTHGVTVAVTDDLAACGYRTPLVGAIRAATTEPEGKKSAKRIMGSTFSWLSEPVDMAVKRSVGATVKHVVAETLFMCEDPIGAVLNRAIDDAVDAGCLTRHETREHLRKHTTLEPVMDRITSLKPAALALAGDWNALAAADKDLLQAVIKQASKGIWSRRKDDDNDWGDD